MNTAAAAPAKLTAAQVAALRWLAAYTDQGKAEGRYPNATMQSKLIAAGLAKRPADGGMATITAAGRSAL
jgi:hypothetical protein